MIWFSSLVIKYYQYSEFMRNNGNIFGAKIDDFANSLLLFERMDDALRLRLQEHPSDEKVLHELASCKRKQGKLNEALEIYIDLSQQHPHKLDYLYAINALNATLNGNMPDNITRPCMSPALEWENFLSEQTIEDMIQYIGEHKADFRPAKVAGGKNNEKSYYDEEARKNTILSLKGNPVKKQVRELITKHLSEITQSLGLSFFEASHIEVKLRAYHNGEYFRTHQDGGTGRRISYTYFFHPEPKCFNGGELVLFDTNTLNSTYNHSFTRIIPKRNSAFFFPSHFYHAVLPVETQDDDFMSARFVINGHIWEKQSTDNATANPT